MISTASAICRSMRSGAMPAAAKEASARKGRVLVAAMQPVVAEIFQISRFDKVLPCHAGVDEAIKAVSAAT